MTADVISHRKPRRKRGGRGWGYVLRRLGALALTLAALATANWLAPHMGRPAAPATTAPAPQQTAVPTLAPAALQEVDVRTEFAAAPAPARLRRARATRRGVPLDARGEVVSDGFEVLTAAELDAITQARD